MTSVSTPGFHQKTSHQWLRNSVELLSSMRFAIALLTLIAIASVIGTVLKQNEPLPNYVNQFGPFWAEIFRALSLYTVYGSWWFLLILAFLVISTSLCVIRNAPKVLVEMRAWKDHVQENGLRAFHHKFEAESALSRAVLVERLGGLLQARGYKFKCRDHERATLLAAKRGAANKLGYILAHSAIVIICIGGLLDGDLWLRMQMLTGSKQPLPNSAQGMLIKDIPERYRLPPDNFSFRANLLVPEGSLAANAVLGTADGMLIQDLPFSIRLKKFTIEHYSTGMPKLFASDILITDLDTGKETEAVVKVNEPVIHRGIAIYQSSFEDGGSKLKLTGYPMQGSQRDSFAVSGEVGGSTALKRANTDMRYTIEFSGFRPFNIENIGNADGRMDARGVATHSLSEQLEARLGSGAKAGKPKDMRNVGPSIQYKLRDVAGQAREFNNYMQPVTIDGQSVFLAGMRDSPAEPFTYLRIPADEHGRVDDWMRLRAALADSVQRAAAAKRFARFALPQSVSADKRDIMRDQLEQSALRALELFAGEVPGKSKDRRDHGGFRAIAVFIDQSVPAAEQQKAAEVLLKILNGGIRELWHVARERDGLPGPANNGVSSAFIENATAALSDSFLYGAPVYLQLIDYQETKASVFQLTRAPGKRVVYLGCLLLVAGVFAMFYIRERRVWIWTRDEESASPQMAGGRVRLLMAMSTSRRTLDFEREFEALRDAVQHTASDGVGRVSVANVPHT